MPAATSPRAQSAPKSVSTRSNGGGYGEPKPAGKDEPLILHQSFFKSVGPRTYAAQIKQARNGNHFLVLMEGRRDEKTNEVRKTRLLVFSEDFPAFFRLLHDAAQFIKSNPVPASVRKRQQQRWAK